MRKFNLETILKILLGLFLFLLPWQTIFIFREVSFGGIKFEYATLGLYATEALFWAVVILFMLWYKQEFKTVGNKIKKFTFTRDRIFLASCLLLVLFVFSSVIWSLDPAIALQKSVHALEAILLFIIIFIGPLSFVEASFCLLAGAGMTALLGIFQFLFQYSSASKWLGLSLHESWQAGTSIITGAEIGRWLRAYGSFSHPNILAGYLALSVILALLTALAVKRKQKCMIGKWFLCHDNYKKRGVFYFLLAILITALFLSFSRSGILALSIFLIITLFLSLHKRTDFYRLRFLSLYSAVMVLLLTIILWPIVNVRTTASSINERESIEERVDGYNRSWEVITEHKWLGVGAGNYTIYLHQENPLLNIWEYQPVHNVFLLLIAELGLIGLGLLALVIFTFSFWQAKEMKFNLIHINLFYFILIISYLVLASLDHYLYSSYVGLVFSGVFWGLVVRFNSHYLHS